MLSKSSRQILEESNRVGVQFLLTEISAGLTFFGVSDTTQSMDTQQRNRRLALTAYETVLRMLPKVDPLEHERQALLDNLAELRNRLISVGCLSDSEGHEPS